MACGLDSYRGYYDQLSIWHTEDHSKGWTVAELRRALTEADGRTFEGYKGGNYTMSRDTPVWVANWGDYDSTACVMVDDRGYCVCLQTWMID